MAKPNYNFEKRQKELIRKRKKEEKLRKKTGNSNDPAPTEEPRMPSI